MVKPRCDDFTIFYTKYEAAVSRLKRQKTNYVWVGLLRELYLLHGTDKSFRL
jgi:hypothetical protein